MPFATSSFKRRLDLFLRLALELALRGVRVVPVFQRRLLRQHDANPYGSAHGDNGHQRGEYMLGHAEDLAGILGRLSAAMLEMGCEAFEAPASEALSTDAGSRSRAETIALRDIVGSVVAARLALSGIWFGIIYWKALRARRVLLAHTYCTPYSTVPLS